MRDVICFLLPPLQTPAFSETLLPVMTNDGPKQECGKSETYLHFLCGPDYGHNASSCLASEPFFYL